MSSHGPNLGKARLTLVSTDRPCMIHEEQHNKLRGLSTETHHTRLTFLDQQSSTNILITTYASKNNSFNAYLRITLGQSDIAFRV